MSITGSHGGSLFPRVREAVTYVSLTPLSQGMWTFCDNVMAIITLLFVRLGVTSSRAQGLLLALYLGITPGGVQRTIQDHMGARD